MDFMEALKNAKKETFRLELLDQYLVDEEKESFETFKRSGKIEDDPETNAWTASLDKLRAVGVVTKRVHVVTLPLSEYIHYELTGYTKTKEKVNLISRSDYSKMKKPFEPKDFWLIDDKILFLVNYDKEGRWLGFTQVNDTVQIAKHVQLKTLLLSKSVPISEFLKSI